MRRKQARRTRAFDPEERQGDAALDAPRDVGAPAVAVDDGSTDVPTVWRRNEPANVGAGESAVGDRPLGVPRATAMTQPLVAAASELRHWLGRHPRVVLVALGCLLFLPGLGARDLWNPDEPRYAEVTREMLATGDFLVPRLNGEIYAHKPPLLFWAMALASVVVGRLDEVAVRLPSVLAAIGTVLLVHGIGRRLFGEAAAFLAAVVLATSTKVLWQARNGQIDMLLTFFVTATAYLWIRGLLGGRPRWYLAGFAVAGLGTLAKGPVALLPLLLSFIAFLLFERRRGELRRMQIGRGLLLWAGVCLAWVVPAALSAGGAYLHEILVTQNLTRYTAGAAYAGTRGHLHPWYYYLTVVPVEFLPWSLLLPAAGVALWRGGSDGDRRSARLLVCWVVVTVLFFSLSAAKRSVYVFQMYPALALLVGAGLALLPQRDRALGRLAGLPVGLFAVLLALAAGAAAVLAPGRPETGLLPADFLGRLLPAVLLMAVGAAVAAWLAFRRRVLLSAGGLAAAFGLGALAILWGLLPSLDSVKSVRPIASRYLALSRPGEPYGFFGGQEPALQFYTGRLGTHLETEAELREFLGRSPRVWLFVEGDALERVKTPIPVVEVARDSGGYTLLASRG